MTEDGIKGRNWCRKKKATKVGGNFFLWGWNEGRLIDVYIRTKK